jgi:hypothetical protein
MKILTRSRIEPATRPAPVAYPTGWATSTEYYIRNSGYKAAIVGTTVVSCPLNLSTILPHQDLASLEHSALPDKPAWPYLISVLTCWSESFIFLMEKSKFM